METTGTSVTGETKRGPARRLAALARSEWRTLAAGTVFLAIGSGATLAYPQALRGLFDRALGSGDASMLDRTVLFALVLVIVHSISIAARYVLFSTAGERVVTQLRRDVYAQVLAREIAFFDERRTGELVSRLVADTAAVQNAVSVNLSMLLRNAVTAIGGVALLWLTSPELTGFMLLVVPPVALGAVFYGRRLRALSREAHDAIAETSAIAEETIAGIRTVRAFAAEHAETVRYGRAVERAFVAARRSIRTSGAFMAVSSCAALSAAALVLWRGGRLVLRGELTPGALTSFVVYTLVVAFALGTLTDLWADFTKATGAAARVFELLDEGPRGAPARLTVPRLRGDVTFEAVRFAYPSRPGAVVLDGVDFHAPAGGVVAVVGPSGAGKSTIAALLSRLYDPIEGRVLVDAIDARELPADDLRRQIGVVAQEPILFSTSIADNIRYARPEATDDEVEQAARAAHAHEFVRAFPAGYATLVGERGVQLSGGQKQRVAIARAILKDPRILVLDEATSALDAESEHLVREALERLMRGRTTLVIAHRLSTVAGADAVLVLDGGRVVQQGSHATLMGEQGLYRRLVERQFVAA